MDAWALLNAGCCMIGLPAAAQLAAGSCAQLLYQQALAGVWVLLSTGCCMCKHDEAATAGLTLLASPCWPHPAGWT